MPKKRLDQMLVTLGLVPTRSQAESWVRLGKAFVNGQQIDKAGHMVAADAKVELRGAEQYVSRAALKLASVAHMFGLDFKDKVVLDVGSSTGGFTDYALQHGARKIIAIEVGTNQLHPSLRGNEKIELHEQTDIRNVMLAGPVGQSFPHRAHDAPRDGGPPMPATRSEVVLSETPDIIVIDVSFISLRDILPHVATLAELQTQIVAMVKPQFEAANDSFKHKGVIKNDRMRRDILKSFEQWATKRFIIVQKADSSIAGAKGNLERFYVLKIAGSQSNTSI